jgi:hypothetical protein
MLKNTLWAGILAGLALTTPLAAQRSDGSSSATHPMQAT